MVETSRIQLGARVDTSGVFFRVWAPVALNVDLLIWSSSAMESSTKISMASAGSGYFEQHVDGIRPGMLYSYRLDGGAPFPDPAARFQPQGVHGPSEVIDPSDFTWTDANWAGVHQTDLIFYELHTGTFTEEGTFSAAEARLPYLADLGVTAIELMPVADWPGRWNWGYDPAALYAPSRAYGRPKDLRRFVDTAHRHGLAVFLDVIYNHLGPDGAYLAAFAPMFTDRHHTPWGCAINLDDRYSEGVRSLFIDNALHWLEEYHFDGLRLDATHALIDDSATHFLAELAAAVAALPGRRRYLIAEDHRNLKTLIVPRDEGGYGLDAVWADDFHHQIRNLIAGDTEGYYAHYIGTTVKDIAETLHEGWYFNGRISPHTGKPRGASTDGVRPEHCVLCIQNHDQIGNRPAGARLHHEIPQHVYRAATSLLLFAPELPLLFMGQEWATTSPFQFFTDHAEPLGKLVSEGRKKEFGDFAAFAGIVPDPQDPATFYRSKLNWAELDSPPHTEMHAFYRALLHLRRQLRGPFVATAHGEAGLILQRGTHLLLVALRDEMILPFPHGAQILLHTEQPAFAPDGQVPDVRGETLYFPRAGAVLTRTDRRVFP